MQAIVSQLDSAGAMSWNSRTAGGRKRFTRATIPVPLRRGIVLSADPTKSAYTHESWTTRPSEEGMGVREVSVSRGAAIESQCRDGNGCEEFHYHESGYRLTACLLASEFASKRLNNMIGHMKGKPNQECGTGHDGCFFCCSYASRQLAQVRRAHLAPEAPWDLN